MELFVIGVLLAAVAGVLVSNYLADRQSQKQTDEEQATSAATAPARAVGTLAATRRRLWFSSDNQSELPQQFQAWAITDLDDAHVRDWIGGLSVEQVQTLTEHLSAFCTSLGFELSWLTARRLVGDTSIHAARAIIEHYCTACWQATLVQTDLQQFRHVINLVDQPFSREHKLVTQKLYADLVRRNAAPPITPELSVAPEIERHEFVAHALRELATHDWALLADAYAAATATA